MLSALIPSERGQPAMPLARQLAHQRFVRPGPLVLGAAPIKPPTPTEDRDRTVSRRSKPSSRASLTGEQPDPWDLLQPQDETSRHRGAKPYRRYRSQAPLCPCTRRLIANQAEGTFGRLRYILGGNRPS